MSSFTSIHQRYGRAARTAIAAAGLVAALAAVPAHAARYGGDFGIADSQGAMPGPKAFYAGTCDLASGVTAQGVAPANPFECLDPGAINLNGFDVNPWLTAPAWRMAPVAQAGAHPDATAAFVMTRDGSNLSGSATSFTPFPAGSVRDIKIDLPVGVGGNPGAVPQCSNEDFAVSPPTCPPETQIGVTEIRTNFTIITFDQLLPVYNLVPLHGRTAEFGIPTAGKLTSIRISATARTDRDFGITTGVERLPTGAPLLQQSVTFWGVPWAASHDIYRPKVEAGKGGMYNGEIPPGGMAPADQAHYDPSWGPIEPFVANPTACDGTTPITRFQMDSWQDVARTADGYPDLTDPLWKVADSPAPPVTGCEKLSFEPKVSFQPETRVADSPSAFDVDLAVPQNNVAPTTMSADPDDATGAPAYFKTAAGLATSHLKDTVVTLPAGVVVAPGAADGLDACSQSEIGVTSTDPLRFDNDDPACPDAAKIGTVEIDTPLLRDPVEGTVYLARQGENPFGTLLALYIVAKSEERGLIVKLAGKVEPDASTGQLTATFTNNPQLPFDHLKVHFIGGPRAALSTPMTCGTFTTNARLTFWAAPGSTATPSDDMSINQGPSGSCANSVAGLPFAPGLSAGVTDGKAGASPSFSTTVTRDAAQQNVGGLDVTLPPGLLASIRGVPQCPDAQAALGTCDAASRIGSTTAVVGAGSAPLSIPQAGKAPTAVYLGGSYKGAPLSLVIKVPAQAGPFDLGTVVVRAALLVDRNDAHVTAKSDPLPQILQGVPVAYRKINVLIDRPGFMRNPTSCDSATIGARVTSSTGTVADLSNRFQAGDCGALPFKPALTATAHQAPEPARRVTAKARAATRATPRSSRPQPKPRAAANPSANLSDGAHPATQFTVSQAPGQANIKSVEATLPLSLALDPDNAEALCSYEGGLASDCPESSVVGSAVAHTPVLAEPLTGKVYFVKGVRFNAKGQAIRTLPTLLLKLHGSGTSAGIEIDLRATSDVNDDDQLVTTFAMVPDAPISDFTLSLDGGDHGILVVTHQKNLCSEDQQMFMSMVGQNGKRSDGYARIATPDCVLAVARAFTATKVDAKVTGFTGPGRITISGTGVRTTSRTIKTAGVTSATLAVKLTTKGRQMRRAKQDVRLRVSFLSKGAKKATVAYSAQPAKRAVPKKAPAKKKR